MQKEDKTIPFLDVLLVIQEDGSLGHKVYRKPTHTDRYLHYNSFHYPSIKNPVCKTLINRAKTICEVENIEGELEHLRSVLKMNGYPKKFIDNAMKTRQQVREKTEYQSSVSLPYIGSASHKIERILKEAGIQLYHSSENKLFRSLCTHKDSVNEFQKPGVYRIPRECGLVYIGLRIESSAIINLRGVPTKLNKQGRRERGGDTRGYYPGARAKKGPGHKLLQIYKYCKI